MEVPVSELTAGLQGHFCRGCCAVVVPLAGCGLQGDVLGCVDRADWGLPVHPQLLFSLQALIPGMQLCLQPGSPSPQPPS